MSKETDKWVPLSEMSRECPRFQLNLHSPQFEGVELMVNADAIKRVMTFSRVYLLRVLQESEKVDVEIGAVDVDGTAELAGVVSSKSKPELKEINILGSNNLSNDYPRYRLQLVELKRDLDLVQQNVSRMEGGAYSAENWASEYNELIKSVLKEAGNASLTTWKPKDATSQLGAFLGVATTDMFFVDFGSVKHLALYFLRYLLISALIVEGYLALSDLVQRRPAFGSVLNFFGFQLSRYLRFLLMLAGEDFVRVVKHSEWSLD